MGLSEKDTFRGLRVHSKLGEGGMGEAYLVSHPVLRMPFAVKTFERAAGEELLSEAHLAARIVSPHVVAVHDAGVDLDLGRAFIVQRFVDGIDLAELIDAHHAIGRRPPTAVVARLLADAARGLHAIHQAGVVHRDIKPSNLFMAGDGHATIGDFGIATSRGASGARWRSVGTPHYMAPEQWRGDQVDRRSDLYALGATAHHLLAGEAPFDAEDLEGLARAHQEVVYAPPSAATPLEAYLYAVVQRLLEKDPARRYPTAAAVLRDLEPLVQPPPRLSHGVLLGKREPVLQRDVGFVGNVRIELFVGDLTSVANDVVVNAANSEMDMRRGVANALRLAGGDAIEQEAKEKASAVPMGSVVWTGAGKLTAKWMAHAVAAMDGAVCLQRCCLRALLGAEQLGAVAVAFPALGTGVGQVPMELAAKLMLDAFVTFAALEPASVRAINVVLYDDAALEAWRAVFDAM